ncbi:MAG: hypothetical protein M1282_11250, partial [Chloroflexi bacterium]|nr:hypothetical protein [Chloroflexota bacterium]
MNKKILALFSVLLIAAFALSACGPSATPATLTIWHGYHAGGSEESTINTLVAQYQKDHPSVKITVLEVPFDQLFN